MIDDALAPILTPASIPAHDDVQAFRPLPILGVIMRAYSRGRGRRIPVAIRVVALIVAVASSALSAQSTTLAATNVASDPDVLGAERLFSAWMDTIADSGWLTPQFSCGRSAQYAR